MVKPDVTLQPSKGIILEAAAQIYAGYIAAGNVKDDQTEHWIKRSIREAIIIARTVDASVASHDVLAIDESITVRPNLDPDSAPPDLSRKKKHAKKKGKPSQKKETIEELAEEVLMEDSPEEELASLEMEEPGNASQEDSSPESSTKERDVSKKHENSADAAKEAIKRMSRTADMPPKP